MFNWRALLVGAVMGLIGTPAHAVTYDWSFTGEMNGLGTLVTDVPTTAGGPAVNITSFLGTFGGQPITQLFAPGTHLNDNKLLALSPGVELSLAGIAFFAGELLFLYHSGGHDFMQTSLAGTFGTFTVSEQVSAVPVPAALPLLATAIGALGFGGWLRRRRLAAA